MSTEPCPYKSLVFFDIEGTGLPYEKPKITEISFIACSSSHFGESKRVPRVLHKLSLCRNPKKTIPPVVVGLTGLDNFLLEHESIFDKETIQLITKFFDQLQQPVCLIAHSGNAYDFPVLARHFTENDMVISISAGMLKLINLFHIHQIPVLLRQVRRQSGGLQIHRKR